MTDPGGKIVSAWMAAARDGAVCAQVARIFAEVAAEVRRRAPVCWASGRCCNFKRTGHLLYVTGLEAAYTLVRAGSAGQGRLAASLEDGGCPYQVMNLCGAHAHKPLGCRLYFCDRTAQEWQNQVYERLISELRAVHASGGVPYRYGEWRAMLSWVMQHAGPRLPRWESAGNESDAPAGGPHHQSEARLTVEGL